MRTVLTVFVVNFILHTRFVCETFYETISSKNGKKLYLLRKQNFVVKGNSKIESSESVKKLTGKNVGYEVGKVRFPFIDKQISDRIFNVKYFHF